MELKGSDDIQMFQNINQIKMDDPEPNKRLILYKDTFSYLKLKISSNELTTF